ncbi:PREDICTED: uncharacterized protein LOC107193127 [Dufourea novaeangliae]|uniref:CHK kinase-like domain-containing protein n=1 Tax=Dufourea novaeangliae TaxID=178035 RepID=A0A154PT03_DUFNO|nr:PREDICTED: uncharacterized protein LOC107193127 [Dufourea novaeangliae]KZC15041.1 hypothetical protein WN55_08449 [Dufourea novaeangliae]
MTGDSVEIKEVVLRDIEPLIRQKLGDHVIVENFKAQSLLPPGENFGSTILKVDVELRDEHAEKTEELHLIGKMLPLTEFQRLVFDSSRTFFKETFMYQTIIPAYNKVELESGVNIHETFDIVPKFYGWRSSIQPDVELDDDAVFLMENLKVKGYYNGDRTVGYDLEHSIIAVKALAKFHALGMAIKQKKPGLFEVFKMHAKLSPMVGDDTLVLEAMLQTIKSDPELSVYYSRCEKVLKEMRISVIWSDVPREPWMTIIHSDFWVNNILFHRNDEGKVDDVKFVDFQLYVYSSAIRDLLFYLFSSIHSDITEEQLEGLMDVYYNTLIEKLNQLGCDTKCFNKEAFREKMAEDAPREFVHLCFMLKVLTLDVKQTNFDYVRIQKFMEQYEGNQLLSKLLRKVVMYFCKHNWLPELNETPE